MRSIRENIRTAQNEVRTKSKVQIFSRMDQTNWSIRALLYRHTQRPKPFLTSELNIFVSSLTTAVGREILPNSLISFHGELRSKPYSATSLQLTLFRPGFFYRLNVQGGSLGTPLRSQEPLKLAQRNFAQ